MSASPQEISSVKSFLHQQFISISSEWVEACISFIKEEHNQTLSLQSLKNFVYQQWLNADLEEIGVSSLPSQLATTQKITLNGCFALQVNGIRDVGRPAYAQLKELERDVNRNAEFSSDPEPTLPSWEAKPTRMLMLNLTDGCTQIQGMEYKPINTLSPNLPPGVKVFVQGPVDCRFGVLLLTFEKIKILGGEVESKLVQFSRKAILREALQLPAADDTETEAVAVDAPSDTDALLNPGGSQLNSAYVPNNHEPLYQNEMNPLRATLPNQNQNERRTSNRSNGNINNKFNSGFGQRIQEISSFHRQQNASTSRNQSNSQNTGNVDNIDAFEVENDEFEQSLDYEFLDEIEKENLNKCNTVETTSGEPDIWDVDEDVLHDVMAFQDEDPGFQMPFEDLPGNSRVSKVDENKPFTYLSSTLETLLSDCTVTIKGFIITVLSKLECTVDKGWNLMVKINDGTASLDVNIHDKVLEGIIGISAPAMVKMQLQAAENPEKRREVMEAISKCKVTLQNYNCLMDIKFTPGSKPCLVKSYPVTELHVQQIRERVESYS